MFYKRHIGEEQWQKIYNYLSDFPRIHARDEDGLRQFVEAVFWIVRSGSQWRLLPSEYGEWNKVYHRFADWADKGIWYKMLYYFQSDADMTQREAQAKYIMIDSTILRAHACATPKKTNKRLKD